MHNKVSPQHDILFKSFHMQNRFNTCPEVAMTKASERLFPGIHLSDNPQANNDAQCDLSTLFAKIPGQDFIIANPGLGGHAKNLLKRVLCTFNSGVMMSSSRSCLAYPVLCNSSAKPTKINEDRVCLRFSSRRLAACPRDVMLPRMNYQPSRIFYYFYSCYINV